MNADPRLMTLWLLALAVIVVGAIFQARLFAYLRRQHPEIWRHLGEPRGFIPPSIGDQGRQLIFVWSRRPHQFADPRLHRLVWSVRILTLLVLGLLLLGPFLIALGLAEPPA